MATSDKPKRIRKRKCEICERVFVDKSRLIDHIDHVHKNQIPDGWSAARYECYLRTGKSEGKCIYCGKPTNFNEVTGKYFRICQSPKCREMASSIADKHMIGKYGKPHLLNDPEQQRKMVYSKKNSGTYKMGKYSVMYDSSYGKDFLEMVDNFLNLSGQDILGPSPHTYYYIYEGKKHFYIPDFYIPSLGLEIEIKDGGDNPNNHPKIQAVDRKKEALKDEVMNSIKNINYIKIVNKNYAEFFALLSKLKDDDIVYYPAWEVSNVKEDITKEGMEEVIDTIPDLDILGFDVKFPYTIRQASKMYDKNIVSYDDLVDLLKDEAKRIRRPEQYTEFVKKVENVREYLIKVENSNKEENKRLSYAARRALKRLNKELLPILKDKRRVLGKVKALRESFELNDSMIVTEASGNSDKFKIPVYILLSQTGTTASKIISKFTKDPFNHSGISLDPFLHNIFTFSMSGDGFVIEDIDSGFIGEHKDTIKYTLYAYMASPEEYTILSNMINDFRQNAEKFRYSVKGLMSFITGKGEIRDDRMFCSEFVAYLLQNANPDLIKKERIKYKPYDLARLKGLTFICRGKLSHYDPQKVKTITREKVEKGGYTLWE